MEYTGSYKTMFSEVFGEDVDILEYRSKSSREHGKCNRCGLPLKKIMYVVQSREEGTEIAYYGAECIKHLM